MSKYRISKHGKIVFCCKHLISRLCAFLLKAPQRAIKQVTKAYRFWIPASGQALWLVLADTHRPLPAHGTLQTQAESGHLSLLPAQGPRADTSPYGSSGPSLW